METNQGREFSTEQTSEISKMLNGEISEEELKQMIQNCRKARDNSYSPYSKFRVGCCLLTNDGKFILGRIILTKEPMWRIFLTV